MVVVLIVILRRSFIAMGIHLSAVRLGSTNFKGSVIISTPSLVVTISLPALLSILYRKSILMDECDEERNFMKSSPWWMIRRRALIGIS